MDHKSRKEIMKMRYRQLEHLARQMDARDIMARHANTRRQWLQRQNDSAYRQEYDRISNELSRNVVGEYNLHKLKAREIELKRLFSHCNV